VPIKGDIFDEVIKFLQDLGIINKCEGECWNDLSDNILQTLRKPLPSRQSQIGWVAPVTVGSRERVEEIQDMDIDHTPSHKTLDPRALPRLAANGLIKTKWPDAVQVRYFGGRIADMLFDFCKYMLYT
jgi:hypothetical protein